MLAFNNNVFSHLPASRVLLDTYTFPPNSHKCSFNVYHFLKGLSTPSVILLLSTVDLVFCSWQNYAETKIVFASNLFNTGLLVGIIIYNTNISQTNSIQDVS